MSKHEESAKPCPNCGHCPTCGHSPRMIPAPYPVPYPYPTYPWQYQRPWVTWTAPNIYTSGQTIGHSQVGSGKTYSISASN